MTRHDTSTEHRGRQPLARTAAAISSPICVYIHAGARGRQHHAYCYGPMPAYYGVSYIYRRTWATTPYMRIYAGARGRQHHAPHRPRDTKAGRARQGEG
eukprot:scaffold78906_cov48-Phaeocystis_antarctica.AAC.1